MASRKGIPNKNKQFLMKRLQDMLGDDFDPVVRMAETAVKMSEIAELSRDIEDYKDCITAWDKIAKYTTPALKAVEVDLTSGGRDLPTIIELVAKR